MVNRVLLGDTGGGVFGLKVSTPGNDVLTGGTLVDNQLSFDSSAPNNLRVLIKGRINVPSGIGLSTTVMYGVTLPAKPPVLLLRSYVVGSDDYLPSMPMAGGYLAESDVKLDRFLIQRSSNDYDYLYVVFYPV